MEMPSMRMGTRTNLNATKHVATSTAMRISVVLGRRPMVSTCSQWGRTEGSCALCTPVLKWKLAESCEQTIISGWPRKGAKGAKLIVPASRKSVDLIRRCKKSERRRWRKTFLFCAFCAFLRPFQRGTKDNSAIESAASSRSIYRSMSSSEKHIAKEISPFDHEHGSRRRQYPFHLIEPKWQKTWDEQQAFRAFNPGDAVPAGHPFGIRHGLSGKVADRKVLPEKFYILDMFPYPSGAGLHVGHPEGYTATDILARYRRARGFNVLHPMGWDAFGLPAEQYAIRTGQHPRQTTTANIEVFKRQIKSLGFSYDWSREIDTTDPKYCKWTQWIFLKLYNSWFNPATNKAESIETLPDQRREFVDSQRLAYVTEAPVWWCEELGTVLANEEVIDGKSEVGGFPVTRKPMRQWMLRITAYAERRSEEHTSE